MSDDIFEKYPQQRGAFDRMVRLVDKAWRRHLHHTPYNSLPGQQNPMATPRTLVGRTKITPAACCYFLANREQNNLAVPVISLASPMARIPRVPDSIVEQQFADEQPVDIFIWFEGTQLLMTFFPRRPDLMEASAQEMLPSRPKTVSDHATATKLYNQAIVDRKKRANRKRGRRASSSGEEDEEEEDAPHQGEGKLDLPDGMVMSQEIWGQGVTGTRDPPRRKRKTKAVSQFAMMLQSMSQQSNKRIMHFSCSQPD